MKKKKIKGYRNLFLVIAFLCIICIIFEGRIKRVIWDWEKKEIEKTWISVEGDKIIREEQAVTEYEGNTYYIQFNECGEVQISSVNQDGKKYVMEEVNEILAGNNKTFSWAIVDEEYLMILGENYSKSYFTEEEGIYSNGPMGVYKGSIIITINLTERMVIEKKTISEGKVIYIDKGKYVVMNQEKIKFYNLNTDELIREEQLKKFEVNGEYLVKNYFKERLEILWIDEDEYVIIGKYDL